MVTFGLLGGIIWSLGGVANIVDMLVKMDPLYALIILTIYTFDRTLMTYKWRLLLQGRGLSFPLLQGLKIYCSSMVWGLLLPTTIGADAFRAYRISRLGLDTNEVMASIVIERIAGFLSALTLALLGMVFLYVMGMLDERFSIMWWVGGLMMVGVTLLFMASMNRRVLRLLFGSLMRRFGHMRVMQVLKRFYDTYQAYQDQKGNLVVFFLLTLLEQSLFIFHSWLIARGLGVPIGLPYLAGAVPLAFMISRAPISFAGIGVYEGAFVFLLSLGGVPPVEALAITIVSRLLEILAWLPWWLADAFSVGYFRPLQKKLELTKTVAPH